MIAALLVALVAQAPAPPRDVKPAVAATAIVSGVVSSDEAQPRPLRRARDAER